jgi:HEPN domain-containing protein
MRSACNRRPRSHDRPSARLAAEKALKALLLALDQEPERTHSIERLLGALELLGLETAPLRQVPLKPLQRMSTASRYPDGDEAPVDLFDQRDGALALRVAGAVVGFVDQQLGDPAEPPSGDGIGDGNEVTVSQPSS